MSILFSRRQTTGEVEYHSAFGLQQVYDVALALLYRGDEVIHIAPNKGEHPVTVADVKSAKANRDRYTREGVRYEPLPVLDH